MDDRQKKINELLDSTEENLQTIEDEKAHLGSLVFQTTEDLSFNEELETTYQKAKNLTTQIDQNTDRIKSIRENNDKLQEKREILKKSEKEIEEIENLNEPIYEEIGKAAYQEYRLTPEAEDEFSDVFQELAKNDKDIQDIDAQLDEFERQKEDKNFMLKILDSGKRILLQTNREVKQKKFPKLHKKAGKDLVQNHDIDKLDDPELEQTLQPYKENNNKIQEIRERDQTLKAEVETIECKLADLGVEKTAKKAIDEIEKENASLETQRTEAFSILGNEVYMQRPEDLVGYEEINNTVQRIQDLFDTNAAQEAEIERLKAEMHAEELGNQIHGKNEKISKLESEIAKRRETIAELQQEISELTDERKQFLELASSPKDSKKGTEKKKKKKSPSKKAEKKDKEENQSTEGAEQVNEEPAKENEEGQQE